MTHKLENKNMDSAYDLTNFSLLSLYNFVKSFLGLVCCSTTHCINSMLKHRHHTLQKSRTWHLACWSRTWHLVSWFRTWHLACWSRKWCNTKITPMVTRCWSSSYFALETAKCHQLLELGKCLDFESCNRILYRFSLIMARILFVGVYFMK